MSPISSPSVHTHWRSARSAQRPLLPRSTRHRALARMTGLAFQLIPRKCTFSLKVQETRWAKKHRKLIRQSTKRTFAHRDLRRMNSKIRGVGSAAKALKGVAMPPVIDDNPVSCRHLPAGEKRERATRLNHPSSNLERRSKTEMPLPGNGEGQHHYLLAATGRTSAVTRRMVTRRFSCSGADVLTFR